MAKTTGGNNNAKTTVKPKNNEITFSEGIVEVTNAHDTAKNIKAYFDAGLSNHDSEHRLINMTYVLESFHITHYMCDNCSYTAMLHKIIGTRKFEITLNNNLIKPKRRDYALACMLGEYINDKNCRAVEKDMNALFSMFRAIPSRESTENREWAEQFALAFLIHDNYLIQLMEMNVPLKKIAKKFNVSTEDVKYYYSIINGSRF